MRVTTSLLADAATTCEGKLYVHGGGWDTLNTPSIPFTHPSLAVVLVVEMEHSEVVEHAFAISLVDNEGSPLSLNGTGRVVPGDPAQLAPGRPALLPLALTFQAVTFQQAGVYKFEVSIDDTVLHAVEFVVRVTPQ